MLDSVVADQILSLKVRYKPLNGFFCASFIYAKCNRVERRLLWEETHAIAQSLSIPWMIAGDLNIIKNPNEKIGGAGPD